MTGTTLLLDLFERLGNLLKRQEVCTKTDLIIKIMVELFSVLALATKEIKQGRFSECAMRFTLLMLNVSQRSLRRCRRGGTRYRLRSIA